MKLEQAIKQERFQDEHVRAAVNLYYTSARLEHYENTLLKPFNLSLQQFNIMRILRGQQGKSISIKDIADRMIDQMSNASRLVEKLRAKELLERKVCPADRRRVEVVLTDKGSSLIEDASVALDQGIRAQLGRLRLEEAIQLNRLLDKLNE